MSSTSLGQLVAKLVALTVEIESLEPEVQSSHDPVYMDSIDGLTVGPTLFYQDKGNDVAGSVLEGNRGLEDPTSNLGAEGDEAASEEDVLDDEDEGPSLGEGEVCIDGQSRLVHRWLDRKYSDRITIETIVACVLDKDQVRGAFDLIVTTKTCIQQWRQEVSLHFDDGHKPSVFILGNGNTSAVSLLGQYDFVICSYQFLQTQFSKMKKFDTECKLAGKHGLDQAEKTLKHKIRMPTSPLFSEIYRKLGMPIRHLILDQVQFVKNADTVTHKAIKALHYSRIGMLSGTLFSNRWTDIFGPINAIPGHPIATFSDFMRIFGTKYSEKQLDPSPTKQARLFKFLMAFTVARPSSLVKLKGLTVYNVSFNLGADAERVVYHTKKFLELVKKSSDADIADLFVDDGRSLALRHVQRAQQWAAHPMLAEIIAPDELQKLREQARALIERYNEEHPN
ncbi:MAG: hypothetical protein LQ339_003012 [Xanthoria mediterranea]|nr:MAG: hypothetical protein LQ339_003012 [Xanthoria mediterranea]